MPNTRISDLTAATSVAGTDVYPSVQTAGVGPVKTSLTQITAFALANAPAGAVATPSIAPTGDTNTGFWFPAADTIAASTGGSERMRINSSGNVGIGTTSPSTTLDVRAAQATFGLTSTTTTNAAYSSFNNAGGIFYAGIDNSGGSAFSGTAYSSVLWSTAATPMVFATNGSEKMRITSAGNVGIGTTSPSELLEVTGAVRANLALRGNFAGGTNIGGIKFLNAAGANTAAIYAETTTGTASDTAFFAFYTMNSGTAGERMRITGAGNVLINTTSISTGCIAAINGKIDLKTGNTSIGKIEAAKSISVTTSATTVISGYVFGGLAIVNGNDGTNQFTDLVFWGYSGTPTVINSQTISGSPAARTYTAVAGDLKLAMASGTYTVAAVAITANNG